MYRYQLIHKKKQKLHYHSTKKFVSSGLLVAEPAMFSWPPSHKRPSKVSGKSRLSVRPL